MSMPTAPAAAEAVISGLSLLSPVSNVAQSAVLEKPTAWAPVGCSAVGESMAGEWKVRWGAHVVRGLGGLWLIVL